MTSINEGTVGKLRRRAGLSILIGLLMGAFGAEPAAATVYAVGAKITSGLPSELYRFNEDGSMDTRWDIPEGYFGLSLTNVGSSLYVAERAGAIKRKISRRLGKRAQFRNAVIQSSEQMLEALANRAPSMCRARSWRRATSAIRATATRPAEIPATRRQG